MSTFSEKIKEEVCHLKYENNALKALIFSLITNKIKIILTNSKQEWYLESNFNFIIRFVAESLKQVFKIDAYFSYSEISNFTKKRTYRLTITNMYFVNLLEELDFFNTKYITSSKATEDEKRAYLVGSFLASGSIGEPTKSIYHLEIRGRQNNYLRTLQSIMIHFHLSPTILQRKYINLIYIKKASEISDFLKIIGAIDSMNYFEDNMISRDLSNQLHRLNNLDISNLAKSVESGNEQIEMISKLIKHNVLETIKSKRFKLFCQLRMEFPAKSLKELADEFAKHNIKITRGGINHLVIKLRELYNQLD